MSSVSDYLLYLERQEMLQRNVLQELDSKAKKIGPQGHEE